jgi:cytochrome c oxidase cbb3-type subunit 3
MMGVVVFAALSLVGCERLQRAEELREWKPSDHHSRDDDKARATGAVSAATPDPGVQLAQLVEFAWRHQCAQCHGQAGKGDGPSGPMMATPDLTREEWQVAASDLDIASVIRSGRGKMPKFDLLPDVVLRGLVARIRSTRGR